MKILVMIIALYLSAPVSAQEMQFPQSWLGKWKGELAWYKTGQAEPQKVNMELDIGRGDSAGIYTWRLSYGAAGEDDRPYILKIKDATKDHWVIDELNGIVLDQFWVGNKFCGAFTVMGNTIVNNYSMEGDKMVVEFFSIGAKPIATTGQGTKESPGVDSYRIGSYQQAILTKQ